MLTQDGPHYPNWDQDATAVEARYGEQDPAHVCAELLEAAARSPTASTGSGDDEWERTGFRSDGAAFTVATFARYLVHDPIHHLHDVHRLTAPARSPTRNRSVTDAHASPTPNRCASSSVSAGHTTGS